MNGVCNLELVRVNKRDGSWAALEDQWRQQCENHGEDYDTYAEASLGTLHDECDDGQIDPASGVFALRDTAGGFHCACFLNSTLLKGFNGKVLRVRHLILSPHYDFADLSIERYSDILSSYFSQLIAVSKTTLPSDHIKLHYRSPYDRTFFATFALNMRGTGVIKNVESVGMWLHITNC